MCVCVCNICIDVKLLPFFPSVLSLLQPSFRNLKFYSNAGGHRGPGGVGGHRRHPPGTRVNVPALESNNLGWFAFSGFSSCRII